MNKRKLVIPFLCVLGISSGILLMPLPIQVFAYEINDFTVPAPITAFGNMTLRLENCTFSYQQGNETQTFTIEYADIKILTINKNNTQETTIDIEARNCQMTGPTSLSFSSLSLSVKIVQQEQKSDLYMEAISYIPLWQILGA